MDCFHLPIIFNSAGLVSLVPARFFALHINQPASLFCTLWMTRLPVPANMFSSKLHHFTEQYKALVKRTYFNSLTTNLWKCVRFTFCKKNLFRNWSDTLSISDAAVFQSASLQRLQHSRGQMTPGAIQVIRIFYIGQKVSERNINFHLE